MRNQPSSATDSAVHVLHLSIAEHGKLLALKHQHKDALRHYQEAIRMAVSIRAPEIFFRHYTQCVLESLEKTESYQEVIEFCRNADQHYQRISAKIPLHKKDHASVLERQAVNELKAGDETSARVSLLRALEIGGKGVLPLSEELLSWLQRNLTVSLSRLQALQEKHHYFVVRRDQVNPQKARSLESLKLPKTAPSDGLILNAGR
ncbi:hypothetical protein [Gynuella sunshinyii]|uniref:Uncharacterized protein n=1 Tax=Gynuella sunshinyii YC6258 TaxID=1445510 RepID=A0A0C5W5B1_9GAMM|nr:hypothetical protein [Gynuella sunshinyii]AJQ97764.1 hypothetical Protein YC6258_05736 [Gynuella sunshinyii YC6258]